MATCTQETEVQNYQRLVSLLIDHGSGVLRKLFLKYVHPVTLDQYLLNHKPTLVVLQKTKNVLNQSQMDLMFPPSGATDIAKFDITLLSCLLKNICGKIPLHEKREIDNLRTIRNEVSGHMAKASIDDQQFKTLWGKISTVLYNLSNFCRDPKFVQETSDNIKELWLRPKLKPASQFSEILIQWYKSDQEIMEQIDKQRKEVTAELVRVKDTTTKIEKQLQNVQATTESIHKRQDELGDKLQTVEERATKQAISEVVKVIDTTTKLYKQQSEMKMKVHKVETTTESIHKQQERLKYDLQTVEQKVTRQEFEMNTELKQVAKTAKAVEKEQVEMERRMKGLADEIKEKTKSFDRDERKTLSDKSKAFLTFHTRHRYVRTQLMIQVERKIQETGSCVISGKPGDGKTIAGAATIKQLFDLDKCVVLSHPRDWKMIDVKQIKAVFIDDIFGMYELDEGSLTEWLSVLGQIEACIGTQKDKIKVIIATRANIFKECSAHVSKFKVFSNIVEFSSDKLHAREKQEILISSLEVHNKRMETSDVESCVRKFSSPIGFPLCCKLFSANSSLHKLGSEFFKTPLKFFENNLRTIAKEALAALVLLFCQSGCMHVSDFYDKKEVSMELQNIAASLGIAQAIDPRLAKYYLEKMDGIYVTHNQGVFTFVHNTVAVCVGLFYGINNPEDVVRTCSSDFLLQCITVQSSDLNVKASTKLELTYHNFKALAKRFISEVIERKEVIKCACHPAFRNKTFLKLFSETIRQEKVEKIFFSVGDKSLKFRHFLNEYVELERSVWKNASGCPAVFLQHLPRCECSPSKNLKAADDMCYICQRKNDCLNRVCERPDLDLFLLLLKHGAVPTKETLDGAAYGGNVDIFQTITNYGIAPNAHTLDDAVKGCTVNMVKLLIDHGVVPDKDTLATALRFSPDVARALLEYDITPDTELLTLAAKLDHSKITIRTMIEHGFLPDTNTLRYVVQTGTVDIVRYVAEQGAAPDTETLNIAVRLGSAGTVIVLLEHGAIPDADTIHYAVETGNDVIVRKLLQHGSVPNVKTLNFAVKGGHIGIVRAVLDCGIAPDEDTIHYAVETGNARLIALIINHGAAADTVSVNWAVKGGNIEMVKSMMQHGGKPDRETLDYAIEGGNVDMVGLVLAHGAVPDTETMYSAIQSGNTDIIRAVIEQGAVADRWALYWAVKAGNVHTVKAVIKYGCTPGTWTVNSAVEVGNIDIIRVVLEHGAVPTTWTMKSAIDTGNVDIVRILLEYGFVTDADTINYAETVGDVEIVRLFSE